MYLNNIYTKVVCFKQTNKAQLQESVVMILKSTAVSLQFQNIYYFNVEFTLLGLLLP